MHSKLHRVAWLVRRRHEAPRSRRRARPRIRPAKLVVERHHPRTRHTPRILGHKLGRGGHHERHRPSNGRVVPAAVPTLALAAEEVSLFDRVMLEGVMSVSITDARPTARRTAGTVAPCRYRATPCPTVTMMEAMAVGLTSWLITGYGTTVTKPSRQRLARHAARSGDHHGGVKPWS